VGIGTAYVRREVGFSTAMHHTASRHTLLKIRSRHAAHAMLNSVVSALFSSLLAGCAQWELL
jgi:hypothetical protein